MPAIEQISSMVELRCSSRERTQTAEDASIKAATVSSTASGVAAAANERHSSAKSIVFHGVRVPPQSKMTASTATDHPHDVLGGIGDRDVLPIAAAPVLDLDHAVGEALAHHHDRRH